MFTLTQTRGGASKGLATLSLVEGALQRRAVVRALQAAQGPRRHRRVEQDAPTAPRQRPRQFPHQGPLQRGDRARHQVDDRRPLRRHARPRHHRLGRRHRLRPSQDDHPARRPELPGEPAQAWQVEMRHPRGRLRCSRRKQYTGLSVYVRVNAGPTGDSWTPIDAGRARDAIVKTVVLGVPPYAAASSRRRCPCASARVGGRGAGEQTITVTTTGDPTGAGDCLTADSSCSLRQAVAAASAGRHHRARRRDVQPHPGDRHRHHAAAHDRG